MPLIPLAIPFGVFRNGTDYAAKNRWFETSLVRWHDGALRSIGGWTRRQDNTFNDIESLSPLGDPEEIFRDCISWRTNVDSTAVVFGSRLNLRYMNPAGTLATITPPAYTPPPFSPFEIGFGTGTYGTLAYGVRSGAPQIPIISRWVFDTWGEDLLALNNVEGILYDYSTGDAAALPVANAPIDIVDFVTTTERIVMAVGGTNLPRQVIWSDIEDNTNWTSTEDNHAGSITLTGSGAIVTIVKVMNENLILTETDAYTARYSGPPFIYRFDRVGEHCRPANANVVTATNTFAMWLGRRNFWIFNGAVQEVKCDVIDYIMEEIDPEASEKSFSVPNADFSEIWWYYQSLSSPNDEVDSYVVYNYEDQFWYIGKLNRTTGLDRGTSDDVLMVDEAGYIYNSELPNVKVIGATYAESGPIELGQGDQNMVVRGIFPDTTRFGVVDMTLYGKAMPSDPEYQYGPYIYNNPTPTRAMGREIRMRIDGLSTKWEVGTMRIDVTTGGGR